VQALHSPPEAPNSRDSFVARWRITPAPLATRLTRLRTAGPIRVFGADLADLADLRLPPEANYPLALLHPPRPLQMTQINASGLNCSRERAPNEEVAAACIFSTLLLFATGALEQGNK
jgi:hypothetical protein